MNRKRLAQWHRLTLLYAYETESGRGTDMDSWGPDAASAAPIIPSNGAVKCTHPAVHTCANTADPTVRAGLMLKPDRRKKLVKPGR